MTDIQRMRMPTDEQRMRERFEDWGRTYYLNLIRTRGGQYQDVLTEAAYAAWRARDAEVQALREALVDTERVPILYAHMDAAWQVERMVSRARDAVADEAGETG